MAHPKLTPIHPGEVLLEGYLEPLGLSQYRLALRLARYFSTSDRFWLNLQATESLGGTLGNDWMRRKYLLV